MIQSSAGGIERNEQPGSAECTAVQAEASEPVAPERRTGHGVQAGILGVTTREIAALAAAVTGTCGKHRRCLDAPAAGGVCVLSNSPSLSYPKKRSFSPVIARGWVREVPPGTKIPQAATITMLTNRGASFSGTQPCQ